jgi:tRNA dimethylallyltransferase
MRVPSDVLRKCWFLAGATACGKTAAGIELANRLNAEVLSLDSMAIYRGMDIGTAKPTPAEQMAVPHHLIDLIEPAADFSVAEYVVASQRVCEELIACEKTPLFVGGTGLYLRSLLRGVFEGPSADLAIRERLERFVREESAEALHARLAEVDPAAANRLPPADVRRVIRALEVFELTGVPASAQMAEGPLPEAERPGRVFWLAPPRAWLHERINRRVDQMFEAGLVQEVRRLLSQPGGLGRSASQALGYKEVVEHLEGRLALDECIVQVKTRTRQFAKRQETWFRNLVEARPVEMTGRESSAELAEKVLALGLAETS